MDFVLEILITVVLVITTILYLMKSKHKYWQRKGLPTLEPSFPFGNFGNPFTRNVHFGLVLQKIYKKLKRMRAMHGGVYMLISPIYVPVDPKIIKNIIVKDFHYFQDRGFYYNERDDPLSANLFAISGPKWRNLRTKLTSTFTSGKMKMMFGTMVDCANNMQKALCTSENSSNRAVEIKELFARYTTDVIGSCAFGLDCNSFTDENSEFRIYGKHIFRPVSRWKSFERTFAFSNPNLGNRLGVTLFSPEVNNFFVNVVRETIEYREANNVRRNDMLQILIDIKNDDDEINALPDNENLHDGKTLSINEIAAQVFVFFVAGFDTSSSTMMFCLYELAINPVIQEKVRNETNFVLEKYNGKMTYEAIMDMKYMGQVIDETLRKYPPLTHLARKCVEDYTVPHTNILIEKGTRVYISTLGLHYDPDYFPEPESFDPERFSEENRYKIQPFTYIPFGEGPRICIGLRFGLMQTKIGLAALLKTNIISLNDKTIRPFNIDRYNFVLTVKDGIWLNFKSTND